MVVKKILIAIVCLLVASAALAAEPKKADETFSVAYCEDCVPFEFCNKDGLPDGLVINYWKLWANKTGVAINFKAAPWEESVRMAKAGEVDAHAGLFYSKKRNEFLEFGAPMTSSDTHLFYSKALPITCNADVLPYRVGVLAGGLAAEFLHEKYPEMSLVEYPDFKAIMSDLASGQLKVFVAETLVGLYYLQQSDLSTRFQYRESQPLYRNYWRVAVPKDKKDSLTAIDDGMASFSPEEKKNINRHWTATAKGRDPGSLVITVDRDYPPFSLLGPDGVPSGMIVDMWKAWSRQTGVPVEFVPESWTGTLEAVKSGEADIHFGLFRSREREEFLLFSGPLFKVDTALFYRADSRNPGGLDRMSGMKVAVIGGSYQESYLKEKYPEIKTVSFADGEGLILAVLKGKADALMHEVLQVEAELDRMQMHGALVKGTDSLFSSFIRAGVRKDRPELIELIDSGFGKIPYQVYSGIEKRWVSNPEDLYFSSDGSPFNLSDDELKWLDDHPMITVAVMDAWPPLDYVNDRGNPEGLGVDYVHLLNKRLGGRLQILAGPFKDNLEAVREKRIDAIMDVTPKKDREPFLDFTTPYMIIPHVIVGRSDGTKYMNEKELADKTIALERGFFNVKYFRETYPDAKVVEFPDTLAALEAVARGRADAYVGNRAVAVYLIERYLLSNLEVQGRIKTKGSVLAIGVRKDWPVLAGILDRALKSIGRREEREILKKWTGQENSPKVELSKSEKLWLRSSPVIRFSVDPDWLPLERIDPKSGQYEGISADLLHMVAKRTGLSLELVPTAKWSDSVKYVRDGRTDMLAAASETAERDEFLDFSNPYIELSNVVVVRQETPFLGSVEDLTGMKVGVSEGNAAHKYLEENYPHLNLVPISGALNGLKMVAEGKCDAYVGTLEVLGYLINQNGLYNLKVALQLPVSRKLCFAARKGLSPQLISILNKGIRSISEKESEAVIRKWISLRVENGIDIWLIIRIALGVGSVAGFIMFVVIRSNRRLASEVRVRQQVEMELLEARDKAEDATRAKSEFLARMSHEIRTPMNAIIGMSHLALQTELTAKQHDYISKIRAGANNLLGIINDILDFSKIEAGKMSMERIAFRLDETMDNLANVIAVKAEEKGLEVLFHVCPDVPNDLVGDPLRLSQILINLANNATKFTEHGDIVISVKPEAQDEETVTLLFCVADSGIGMTEEQKSRLFKSFSQADGSTTRKYGGTGLGLAICKRLVEMMDGRVWVDSVPGEGSTFSFTAVLGKGEKVECSYTPAADLRGLRALVVDDNSTSRAILSEALESMTFKVSTAASGDEALKLIKEATESGNPYELVLLDWKMPGLDGIETSRRIEREAGRELPKILMVSAYGREEIMEEAEAAGLEAFLVKPVNQSVLFDTIMGVFGHNVERKTRRTLGLSEIPEGLSAIKGGRILLAEDNEINQQIAVEILERAGMVVEVVDNGKDAVERTLENEYDLVLMDIQMPVLDGLSAAGHIRGNGIGHELLPIVAMTAHAMAGDREKSIEAGMDDHITKPIDPELLLGILIKWIKPGERELPEGYVSATERKDRELAADDLPLEGVPGINTKSGLSKVSGNRELYKKLLGQFRAKYMTPVQDIEAQLQNGEADVAIRTAHTIKGVAANLGADTLSRSAGEVERALRAGEESIETLLADMQTCIDTVAKGLDELLPAKEDDGSAGGSKIDSAVCLEFIAGIESAVGSNLSEAMETMGRLSKEVEGSEYADPVGRASALLDDFEPDEAMDILNELADKLSSAEILPDDSVPDNLGEKIKAFIEFMDNDISQAVGLAEEIKGLVAGTYLIDPVRKMVQALDDFETDEARSEALSILEKLDS
ncbi:transporter substrate-binding domain-containing protein [Maridesulfovibrio sp.]|uniref:transporter substrate-binding domain-containing protein n=1 Tax=Maridesulfovibrio sp. TaxID=2795000 RepID=UPI002A186D7F|nr:transporter substrate-binding domain-containing protein [Maridesulfovibrio sp.]